MRVGAGAAALGAFADGGTAEAAAREVAGSPADSPAPRKLVSDAEMAIAADWARAFAAASADVRKQAKTDLLPDLLQPPFSFIYGC